ncbi:MAG TPA: hypothetical protein VNX68_05985 [Nitrosopumilaceae archaeon]|nr:hypothetical protein [Nitrosopumilaceae archaeon]
MVKSSNGVGFNINFQYGAIGQTLKNGTKNSTPLSGVEAEKFFNKMIKERLAKGYTQEGESKVSAFASAGIVEKKTHGIFPQLLNSIEEEEMLRLINDDRYLAQQKFDGNRRIVVSDVSDKLGFIQTKDTIGLNKKGEIVPLQKGIQESINLHMCTLDGEIIGDKLYVFDLISLAGTDFKNKSCESRYKILASMKFGNNIEVVKTAYTTDEKRELYKDLKARNAEGVVFKLKDAPYAAGRPNSGGAQLKYKFQKTGTFIVKEHTKGKRSIGLEMIDEKNERVFLGKCTIPPNHEIPAIGDFVEVQYLYAFPNGGCIFQPVYLKKRDDCDLTDVLTSQLVYKAE